MGGGASRRRAIPPETRATGWQKITARPIEVRTTRQSQAQKTPPECKFGSMGVYFHRKASTGTGRLGDGAGWGNGWGGASGRRTERVVPSVVRWVANRNQRGSATRALSLHTAPSGLIGSPFERESTLSWPQESSTTTRKSTHKHREMPSKNTTFATEEERAAAAAREANKKKKEVELANGYPLKFLQSLGGKKHFAPLLTPADGRAFFESSFKRRLCIVPKEYMVPLVHSSPLAVGDVHNHSFKLLASSLTEETLDRAGGATKSILASLRNFQTLEMDPDTALPMMAKEGDAKRKRAVISPTVTPNFYSREEVFLRYFPAFLSGEKDALFSNATVEGSKTTLIDALLTKFLYGLDPVEALPPQGSKEARVIWESNMRDKLFIVADRPITAPTSVSDLPTSTDGQIDSYGIYYTIHMPDVKHVLDNVQCQGKRLIQQADDRIVQHWVNLTTVLVGYDHVPEAARVYLANRLASINFDQRALSAEAERVCSSTWQSLIEAGKESTNAKGRVINEITDEIARTVTQTWSDKLFANPSIDVTNADGDVTTTLMFNSDEPERAMFGLYFTKANYHDAKTYQASDYHANLKKMSVVFKAVAYAILGKDPPSAIVTFDPEATCAPKGRGRKRSQAQAHETSGASTTLVAELMELVKSLDKKLDAVTETVDTLSVELAKENKRMRKLREHVFANLPVIPEDDNDDE